MRDVWRTLSTALVAALVTANPGGAQEPSCLDGWRSADLGFSYRAEIRSIIRTGWDRSWPRFAAEPTVTDVEAGGAFSDVVQEGDAISAIDGVPVTTAEGSRRFGTVKPGDTVRLSLRRNEQLVDVEIVAGEECVDKDRAARSVPDTRIFGAGGIRPLPDWIDQKVEWGWTGISAICAPCGFRRDDSGRWYPYIDAFPVVQRIEPESPADRAGIQVGDEIREINGLSLETRRGARIWWYHRAPGDTLRLTFSRDGEQYAAEVVSVTAPEDLPQAAHRAREYWSEELPRIEEAGPTLHWGVIEDLFIQVRGMREDLTVFRGNGQLVIQTEGESTIQLRPRREGDHWWGFMRPPPPPPPAVVVSDLGNAVKAQETHHDRHGTYTPFLDSLDFRPDAASVTVRRADEHTYVMVASYGDGVWCVSKHGGHVEEGDRCGEDDPDLAEPAVRTLIDAMRAQEAHYARHKTYSASVESLDFQPEVEVAVTHADSSSYMMQATDEDGVWCVSSRDANIQKGDRCGEDAERS